MPKRGKNRKNKKKTKFVYDNLYDGIHPFSDLAEKWYSKICSSIKYDLEYYKLNDLFLDSEEEMEEKVDDTWDFKRK